MKRQRLEMLKQARTSPKIIAEARRCGITVDQLIEQRSREDDDDLLDMIEKCPPNALGERMAFRELKVLVPPAHANEPSILEGGFKQIRLNEPRKSVDPSTFNTMRQLIRKRWSPNYTMLDKNWYASLAEQGVIPRLTRKIGCERVRAKQTCNTAPSLEYKT